MEIRLAVLADGANVTADNKLNILGEFNVIWAESAPVRWPQMYLVLKLDAAPNEGPKHNLTINVVDEGGRIVAPAINGLIDLGTPFRPGEPHRGQYIIGVEGAVFPAFGRYSFEVLADGKRLGGIPITVVERR